MILWLFACSGKSDPVVHDSAAPADTGTVVEEGPPALPQPADAEDLDPADGVVHFALEAAPFSYEVNGETVDGYAYNGQVPGPTIRAEVGDTVVVDFTNMLADTTTVHWHGLSVPNAMDGITWLADPLLPGESFTYTFTVDRAGTFWYHPHVDVDRQVDLGLYGAIVVEDPAEPVADRELLVVWDAWAETGAVEDQDHAAPDPADLVWTANGVVAPMLELAAGERVRVRMINAANTAYLDLRWPSMRQVASDQGLLAVLAEPSSVVLAPGDRAEFEWLVDEGFTVETGLYTASGGAAFGEARPLLDVAVPAPGAVPEGLAWPFSGESPSADAGQSDIVWVFSGGAVGEEWLINGEAYPDITVQTLALGSEAVIEVRNLSATEHPFHLHGHAFEVLSVDDMAPAARTVEDTLNLGIRQRARLRLVADNPGDWMAHCHLLQHEEGGMMTVLRVE
ncbi:MAG: multicopper oxidase family protein [Myxococcota bacterium]